jgi:hypothetical protein
MSFKGLYLFIESFANKIMINIHHTLTEQFINSRSFCSLLKYTRI